MTEAAGNGLPSERDDVFDKQVNTELAVIAGALYGGPETILRTQGLLEADSFYLEKHRIVFDSMVELAQQGIKPDFVTLCEDLDRRERTAMVGGRSGVLEIIDGFGTPQNVHLYCKVLRSSAGHRRIARKAEEAMYAARNGHGSSDLAALTFQLNEEAQRVAADAVDSQLFDFIDFSLDIPPLDWIVPGWLSRQDIVIFAGEAGIGKSTTLAALAIALAKGERWCGIDVVRSQRVLYFDEEQSLPEAHRLFKRLGAPSENLQVAVAQGANFSTPNGFRGLEQAVAKFRPDVVFIDSLTHAFLGVPENDATEVGAIYARNVLPMRRDYDLAFVWSHHLSKPPGDSRSRPSDLQRLRGSTVHSAQCSTVWVANPSDKLLEVQQVKRRGAEKLGMRISQTVNPDDESIILEGQPSKGEIIKASKAKAEVTREKIRLFVVTAGRWVSRVDVQNHVGLKKTAVCDHLSRLVESGAIDTALVRRDDMYFAPLSSASSGSSDSMNPNDTTLWESTDNDIET